jgi:hypothetical protein
LLDEARDLPVVFHHEDFHEEEDRIGVLNAS